MQVRRASPEDAAAIAAVHVHTWQLAYVDYFPADYLEGMSRLLTDAALARRREVLTDQAATTFVAEEDGKVRGFATVMPNQDGLGDEVSELGAIYVDPGVWGRGIGTALLREAEASLATSGFERAVLWTLGANQRTRRFYETNGWRFDGTTKPHRAGPELVRYARELGSGAPSP